jgi:hypothetical protein
MHRNVWKLLEGVLCALIFVAAAQPALAQQCENADVECVPPVFGPWGYEGDGDRNRLPTIAAAVAELEAQAAQMQSNLRLADPNATVTLNFPATFAPFFDPPILPYIYPSCMTRPEPDKPPYVSGEWCVQYAAKQRQMTRSGIARFMEVFFGTPSESQGPRLHKFRPVSCPPGYSRLGSWDFDCYRYVTDGVKTRRNVGTCCTSVGNPINVATGSKVEIARDGSVGSEFPLELVRIYDSQFLAENGNTDWSGSTVGDKWRWL